MNNSVMRIYVEDNKNTRCYEQGYYVTFLLKKIKSDSDELKRILVKGC